MDTSKDQSLAHTCSPFSRDCPLCMHPACKNISRDFRLESLLIRYKYLSRVFNKPLLACDAFLELRRGSRGREWLEKRKGLQMGQGHQHRGEKKLGFTVEVSRRTPA